MQWYYGENGQQSGPVDDNQFRALAAAGRIGPATLVWREGLPTWQPFSQIVASGMLAIPSPGNPYPNPHGYSVLNPATSGLAITSLICGIVGLVSCMVFVGIPAVICGHMAMSQIAKSPVPMTGRGMALTGLVCGYLCMLIMLSFVAMMMFAFLAQP